MRFTQLGILGFLTFFGLHAFAQQPEVFELPAAPKALLIRLAPEASDSDAYVHVFNPSNGRGILSTHRQEFMLGSKDMALLTRNGKDSFRLMFLLLQQRKIKAGDDEMSDYVRQSQWRLPTKLAYSRTRQLHLEARIVEIRPNVVIISLKPAIIQEAYLKALAQRFKKTQPKVDAAWKLLGQRKYSGARQSFDALLAKPKELSPESQERSRFGRGLARFHLEGCEAMESDFRGVETGTAFREDVSYFRGLCAVEAQRNSEARTEFTKILDWNSRRYTEQSRFYLGVVAEQEGDYEKAEGAYLDTVDFAEDASIVALAKDRLAKLQALKARDAYAKKIFNVIATVGGGWDSNAISLPASLRPADYSVESAKTGSWMGVLVLEAKNPWLYPLEQKFTYNLFTLNHLAEDIAAGNDLQSHEVGASLAIDGAQGAQHKYSATYSITSLGTWSDSEKYITSPSLKWDWVRPMSAPQDANPRFLSLNTKVSYLMPANEAVTAANDATAWSVSNRSTLRIPSPGLTWGPGGEAELKFAKGEENTLARAGAFAFVEKPVGPEAWNLNLSGEVGAAATLYYASDASRKDYELRASAGVARLWASWFETRLQLSYNKNLSSGDLFKYDRIQAGFLLNAFY
jgi:hypothetical protein